MILKAECPACGYVAFGDFGVPKRCPLCGILLRIVPNEEEEEWTIKWSERKNKYDVPNDAGLFTRLWWVIEDYVSLSDRATFGLVIFALVLLWLIVAYASPGPH